MTEKMNEYREKISLQCVEEIFAIFRKYELKMSESAGILGSIFGVMTSLTEENYPFISFFNSFMRTYHANYKGSETHEISNPLKPNSKE